MRWMIYVQTEGGQVLQGTLEHIRESVSRGPRRLLFPSLLPEYRRYSRYIENERLLAYISFTDIHRISDRLTDKKNICMQFQY